MQNFQESEIKEIAIFNSGEEMPSELAEQFQLIAINVMMH
jgi:hypothetical protein